MPKYDRGEFDFLPISWTRAFEIVSCESDSGVTQNALL